MTPLFVGSAQPELRAALIRWTSRLIWPDSQKTLPDGVCLAVFDGGEPVGCVVYHEYDPDTGVIEMSAAATSRRWLTRPVLRMMFGYPFRDLECQMVVTRVSARDGQKHLHRIFHSYGFKSQVIPRLFGRHEDGILFRLTDDDWRKSRFYEEA